MATERNTLNYNDGYAEINFKLWAYGAEDWVILNETAAEQDANENCESLINGKIEEFNKSYKLSLTTPDKTYSADYLLDTIITGVYVTAGVELGYYGYSEVEIEIEYDDGSTLSEKIATDYIEALYDWMLSKEVDLPSDCEQCNSESLYDYMIRYPEDITDKDEVEYFFNSVNDAGYVYDYESCDYIQRHDATGLQLYRNDNHVLRKEDDCKLTLMMYEYENKKKAKAAEVA